MTWPGYPRQRELLEAAYLHVLGSGLAGMSLTAAVERHLRDAGQTH